MVDKTPEYTGSVQYIERCDGLIRSFHNFMAERKLTEAIIVLRSFYTEIKPYFKKNDDVETEKKKVINNIRPNITDLFDWFEKMNMIYHSNGLAMKMNNTSFMREV